MSSSTVAWDLPPETDEARENSSMLPDLALFALIALPLTVPVINLPLPETASLVMVAVAWLRRPSMPTPRPRWFPALLLLLFASLTLSTLANHVDGTRRLGHMVIYILLALTLSSGRIHRLAAARGLGLGLTIGAATALVNAVNPVFETGYAGRLTGWFHDPNVAGYELTVLGAIALTGAGHGARRTVGAIALAVVVLLTFSRTSLVALLLGAVWLLVRRLGRIWMAVGIAGLAAFGLNAIPADWKLWGPYSGREGSDELRTRILHQEHLQIAEHPWIGNGAGTSRVHLGPVDTFFFHSSYLGLRNEAGWIGLVIFLTLLGLVLLRLLQLPHGLRHPWHEAALIMLAVVGMSLGEVFLELPAAIAIGLGMRHVIAPRELRPSDRTDSPDHVF